MGVKRLQPTDAEVAVLEALAAQGESLSARGMAGAPAFRGQLRFVDPARNCLIVARSGDRAADAALLAQARGDFFVEWGEWRIAFAADGPAAVSHEGTDAIRLTFPEAVSISRRRIFERAPVGDDSLRCVVHAAGVPVFETIVTDISQGGVGLQVESARDVLEPGMVLSSCRIGRPDGEPVTVDLEVRHTAVTVRPDGRRVVRAGCRFVNLSPGAVALVAQFVGTRSRSP